MQSYGKKHTQIVQIKACIEGLGKSPLRPPRAGDMGGNPSAAATTPFSPLHHITATGDGPPPIRAHPQGRRRRDLRQEGCGRSVSTRGGHSTTMAVALQRGVVGDMDLRMRAWKVEGEGVRWWISPVAVVAVFPTAATSMTGFDGEGLGGARSTAQVG